MGHENEHLKIRIGYVLANLQFNVLLMDRYVNALF